MRRTTDELRGFAREAFLQGLSQGVATLGYLAQIVIITHGLGLEAFGRYSVVLAMVTLIQQFADVRVEQATITHGASALTAKDHARAAGIIQLSYLVDVTTGLAGFAIAAGLAPWLGPRLVGADGTALVLIYASTLLVSTLDGSSGATLRLFGRYGWMLGYAITREVIRIALVALAVADGSLRTLFFALLALDAVSGVLLVAIATRAFHRGTGIRLTTSHLTRARDDRRGMFRMILHTNVTGYSRLAQGQLPALVLAAAHTPLVVGIYKIGTAAGLALGRLTDPGLYVILPRLARLWSERRLSELRRLLRQITMLSAPGMLLAAGVVIAFRGPLLRLVGGAEATAAEGVLVLAVIAQALAGTVFWAGPALLAMGQSALTARTQLVALLVQVPAAIWLGTAFAAEGAAFSLLASYALVVGSYAILAIRRLRRPPQVGDPPAPPTTAMLEAAPPQS